MSAKVMVITSEEMADGFRLAGTEVRVAGDDAEAARVLKEVALEGICGLVIIDEGVMNVLAPEDKKALERLERPLVLPLAMTAASRWRMEDRTDYLAKLIRSAIGYHVKLTD